MNCGLPELNKENVMFVIDKHVNALEIMRDDFEEKAMKDVKGSINQAGQVMFALLCVKIIRTDMRELQEEHSMYSRNEIIEILDEVNTQYGSDLQLRTMNIITATEPGDLYKDIYKLDACSGYAKYVFDVEEIMPILKKKVEGK